MKQILFLSDFLLIRDSLDQNLLDQTVDCYAKVKKGTDDNHWTNKINLTLSLNKLVESLNDPYLHFDTDEQKIAKVYEVVKIMYDLMHVGPTYYIKRLSTPNPPKNSSTTENE